MPTAHSTWFVVVLRTRQGSQTCSLPGGVVNGHRLARMPEGKHQTSNVILAAVIVDRCKNSAHAQAAALHGPSRNPSPCPSSKPAEQESVATNTKRVSFSVFARLATLEWVSRFLDERIEGAQAVAGPAVPVLKTERGCHSNRVP